MLYASVRLLVGLGMLAAYFHIYIFTLEMPDRYICDRAPCTGLTTCYVGKLKPGFKFQAADCAISN